MIGNCCYFAGSEVQRIVVEALIRTADVFVPLQSIAGNTKGL